MELKLIKAGQTGTGILIEHDAGYISPIDERNKPIDSLLHRAFSENKTAYYITVKK